MARRKQEDTPAPGSPAWMATYGDMMTLVLCFFVLLFSMSTIEADKFQQISQAMKDQFSVTLSGTSAQATSVGKLVGSGIAQLPNLDRGILEVSKAAQSEAESSAQMSQMASDFKTYFAQIESTSQVIEVESTEDYVKLRFEDYVLFDLGRAELKTEAVEILNVVAEQLIKYPDNDIKVEGHTDNLPISTLQYPDNMYLSAARAISVISFFRDEKGFSPQRLSAEGFGEYWPVATNETPEGRAQNRRVEIKIMSLSQSEQNLSGIPVQ